jgi:hypothetical protein
MRNDLCGIMGRIVSIKTLHLAVKAIDHDSGKVADAEAAVASAALRATHDGQQQALVAIADAARAHWQQLAHVAQVAAGLQPPAHVVAPFVPPPSTRDARVDELRAQPLVDYIVTTLTSGAAMVELYDTPGDALASAKLATRHGTALRDAQPRLVAVIRANTTVQLHAALTATLADVVLDFWRTGVQGYTAADLAKAGISATQAVLLRTITMIKVHDDTQAHWDAFAALNPPGAVGFSERIVASVVGVTEPQLKAHLTHTVLDDTLVDQATQGATIFVRYIVSQSKLAAAKAAAVDAQVHAAVAGLQLVIAGLQADHGRLELQLRERGRGQQRREQGQQGQQGQGHGREQRQPRGQVVGSPDYTGCNFRLPGGALCGNPGHARVDHPG